MWSTGTWVRPGRTGMGNCIYVHGYLGIQETDAKSRHRKQGMLPKLKETN